MPHPGKQKSHSSHWVLGPIHFSGVRGHPHVGFMHGCLPFDLRLSHFLQNIADDVNQTFYDDEYSANLTVSINGPSLKNELT